MKYPTIFHHFINSGDKKSWVQAIKDHKRYGHVKEKIKKAVESQEVREGLDLQKAVSEIYQIAKGSAEDARRYGDYRAVGSCLGPAVRVLELLCQGEPKNINLNVSTSDSDLDAKLERLIQKRKA